MIQSFQRKPEISTNIGEDRPDTPRGKVKFNFCKTNRTNLLASEDIIKKLMTRHTLEKSLQFADPVEESGPHSMKSLRPMTKGQRARNRQNTAGPSLQKT